ncbi:MAG: methyltransferase domain-containing protein [Chloroflexi bacterium]|nr:methyltransferase domain-containing protein [Chloroflexota bacterium]
MTSMPSPPSAVVRPPSVFDEVAEQYDDTHSPAVTEHYLAKRARFIDGLLQPASTIVDVGCGTGYLAARLATLGHRVTGCDPSAGMLEQARRRERRAVRWIQADGAGLPIPPASVDCAITVAALHHVFDPRRVAQTVRELYRIVRPSGIVIIWDHNPNNPYWPILMARISHDLENVRLVPASELVETLRSCGARDIQVSQSGWVPDFTPSWAIGLGQLGERVLEWLPGVRRLGAHNVVVVRK